MCTLSDVMVEVQYVHQGALHVWVETECSGAPVRTTERCYRALSWKICFWDTVEGGLHAAARPCTPNFGLTPLHALSRPIPAKFCSQGVHGLVALRWQALPSPTPPRARHAFLAHDVIDHRVVLSASLRYRLLFSLDSYLPLSLSLSLSLPLEPPGHLRAFVFSPSFLRARHACRGVAAPPSSRPRSRGGAAALPSARPGRCSLSTA